MRLRADLNQQRFQPRVDNGHGSHVAGTVLGGIMNADFAARRRGVDAGRGAGGDADRREGSEFGRQRNVLNVIAGIDCASATLGGRALSSQQGRFIQRDLRSGRRSGGQQCRERGSLVAWRLATIYQRSQLPRARSVTVAAAYDDNYPNCDFPNQTVPTSRLRSNPVVDQRCCFSNRSSMLEVAPGCIIFSDDSKAAGNGWSGSAAPTGRRRTWPGWRLCCSTGSDVTPAQVRQFIIIGAIDPVRRASTTTSAGAGSI